MPSSELRAQPSSAPAATPRDYSWADHLIYMEAGAELAAQASVPGEVPRRSGLLLCASIAAVALLAQSGFERALGTHALDAALLAMLVGIAVGNSGLDPKTWRSGARFVIGTVLPAGIILLGARLDWGDLVGVGLHGLGLAIGVVALSGLTLYGLFRAGWIDGRLATLLAVGNGICGGSAIVAVAPAIGAREDEVAVSVSTVALLGLFGMLGLPLAGALFRMDPVAFGTWSGLVIQQTPQVIAAGFSHGPAAAEAATVVKLVRISLLAPVVFLVGILWRGRGRSRADPMQLRGLVPSFAIGLVLLAGLTSLGLLPDVAVSLPAHSAFGARGLNFGTQALAVHASKLCLIVSMAAVGLETRWSTLRRTGRTAFSAAAIGALMITAAAGMAVTVL